VPRPRSTPGTGMRRQSTLATRHPIDRARAASKRPRQFTECPHLADQALGKMCGHAKMTFRVFTLTLTFVFFTPVMLRVSSRRRDGDAAQVGARLPGGGSAPARSRRRANRVDVSCLAGHRLIAAGLVPLGASSRSSRTRSTCRPSPPHLGRSLSPAPPAAITEPGLSASLDAAPDTRRRLPGARSRTPLLTP
jgi:hypothetical protein